MTDSLLREIRRAAPARAVPPRPDRSGEIPLQDRLRLLELSIASTRKRLESQDLLLRGLRGETQRLKGRLKGLPMTGAPKASRWVRLLPYGLLVAAGLALGHVSPQAASLPPLTARATVLPAPPLEETPVLGLSEEEASFEVLDLLYSYKPQGSDLSLQEILGPEIQSAQNESPWVVTQDQGQVYRVSLQPYGDSREGAPLYEFEVDLAAKTVKASPETARSLVAYRSE